MGGLHVGAERRVNFEHVQALLTIIYKRHWEWQEDRRDEWTRGFLQVSDFVRCGLLEEMNDVRRGCLFREL